MPIKTGYPSKDRVHEDYYGKEVTSQKLPEGVTIYDHIYNCNKNRLKLPAINYYDNKITYRDFLDNSTKVAMALAHYGVKKGDCITVIVPSIPEAFYILLGASRLGAIASFVDPRYGEIAIQHKINDTDSKLVIAFEGSVKTFNKKTNSFNEIHVLDKIGNIIKKTGVKTVIALPASNSITLKSVLKNDIIRANMFKKNIYQFTDVHSWDYFFKTNRFNYNMAFPEFEKNRPVVIVSTGGSTGLPKSALFSNENIVQATSQIKLGKVFPEEARWYDIMPPSIIYGLADGSVLPFSLGNEVRINPDPTAMSLKTPGQLLMVEDFVRFDPHTITCAPNHVFAILNSKEWKENPHSLVSFGVGGDCLQLEKTIEANERLKEIRRPKDFDKERFYGDDEDQLLINYGYGSTEVTGCASVSPSNKAIKIGTVGLTLPFQVVAAFEKNKETNEFEELPYVKNEELDHVPDNKIGELCIEGPNIMLGYLNNKEETENTIITHTDGKKWVHTGDIGFVDEEGYVHFVDRAKYIGVGHDGFKVAPSEIESVILEEPSIETCKAVILSDLENQRGQVIKLYYTVKPECLPCDIDALENKLNLMCSKSLADYKCPYDYECIERLPLTPSGKIDVMTLRKDAEEKLRGKLLLKK